MISPYHIVKNGIKKYKNHWKEIFLFSFILSLTGSLATLLLFIQGNALWGNTNSLNYIFTIFYFLLTFNAIFIFINSIKYLINSKKVKFKNLFSNFKIKTIINLILLSLILLTVFSVTYVFPNLILATIAEIVGPGILNIILFITSIIFMAIGVFIIIYLNFAHMVIIDDTKNSFKNIINKSWYLVKNNWWSVFFNRSVLVLFNLVFSYLTILLFVRIIPISWIETLYNQNIITIPLIITYLLSVLIFSTILSFINLPYEASFYSLYKEAKK